MTCIVAIETTDGVVIGSDRMGSNGHTGSPVTEAKIFTKGEVTIGYTSSFRMGQLLQYALAIPDIKQDQNIDEWVAVDFIQALRTTYKDHGWDEVKDGVAIGGTFILVVRSRAYIIQDNYSFIRRITGEYAVGSGCDYALGSLRSTRDKMPTTDRVLEALATAAEYVVSVAGPFDIIELSAPKG